MNHNAFLTEQDKTVTAGHAYRPRTRWVGMIGLLLAAVLVTAMAQTAQAADLSTCAAIIENRWVRGEQVAFDACTAAIAAEGQSLERGNANFQIGRWGRYTVVVRDGSAIFYRWGSSGRFRYYGELSPADEPAAPAPPTADDPDGDRIVGEADRCPMVPETVNGVFDSDGCSDSIDDLLQFAITDLDGYWRTATEALGESYRPPRAVRAYRDPADRSLRFNAFYSPYGHYIAYDMDLMEHSLSRFGDFAPVAIMAHEWGHLSQNNLGIEREYTIYTELMADCLAGAYTTHLAERGLLEEGDLDEGLHQMYTIGDPAATPWFHPNAHGSGEQRYQAFLNGFEEGLDFCLTTY